MGSIAKMMKESKLIRVHIPLPRVYAKECKYKITKKKKFKKGTKESKNPSVIILARYLQDDNILKDSVFEESLLQYRLYEKKLKKLIHTHHLAIELKEKCKIFPAELKRRLHVDKPPNDVKAVTDIDCGFFGYLNYRAHFKGPPLFKSLPFLYQKQMRTKQEIGYRLDSILNIDTHHKRENKKYEDTVQLYKEQLKQLDLFISEDYEKSITCLRKSESLFANKIKAKISEFKNLALTQFSLQSNLIGIDYLYHQQLKYGRFLYFISPPSWRAKNREFASSIEIEAKGFDLGTSSEEDTFNVIFENLKKECSEGLVKPVLYFTEPENLMNIFVSTEKRQLQHFMHVTQTSPHTVSLLNGIKTLKKSIQIDSEFVAHIIKDVGNLLNFHDERATELQNKFLKILHGLFYDTVAATDVLQYQTHLEWCYKMVFKVKPNITIFSVAKALEDMYMEYSFNLELYNGDETKEALRQSVEEEKKRMMKANKAARELLQFNQLAKSLIRAYAVDKSAKVTFNLPVHQHLSRKKKGQQIKASVRRSSQRQLTDAEIEYLQLFTDWNEAKNPAKYLQSL